MLQKEQQLYSAPDIKEPNRTPELSGLTNFLDQVKTEVYRDWVQETTDYLSSPKIKTACPDKQSLKKLLAIENFRAFENLPQTGQADTWRTILDCLSIRETQVLLAAQHRYHNLSEIDRSKLELAPSEIKLVLDLALAVQNPADKVYKQQLKRQMSGENRDYPQGETGEIYLYDGQPLAKVFVQNGELPALISSLLSFSTRISQEVTKGELPPSYLYLSDYMSSLALAYNSPETDPEQIFTIWKETGNARLKLAKSGCPILLNPAEYTLSCGHIGTELLVALNLGENCHFSRLGAEYLNYCSKLCSVSRD